MPWISRELGRLDVGPFTEKDVLGDRIPELQYTSTKNWVMERGGVEINVGKNVPGAVNAGDRVLVHSKTIVRPEWIEIICCVPDAVTIREKECAPLGVRLCHGYDRRMTHLVTEEITGEPNQLPVLLLGGGIVTPKWVKELFRRANLPRTGSSPDFQSPALDDYLPPFSPNIISAYAEPGLWTQKLDRRTLFEGRHFVFLLEGDSLSSLWKNIMDAGNTDYETFDVRNGSSKWSGTLTLLRAKGREHAFNITLIGDEGSLSAATGRSWKEFIRVMEQIGLRLIHFSKLTEAILWCDADVLKSEFDPGTVNDKSAENIPGTISEASSLELSQDRSNMLLKRRVRQPSAEPMSGSDPNVQVTSPLLAESIPALDSSVQTLLGRSKLKRRDRTQMSQASETPTVSLLDKHRQLFEETDPDRHFASQASNDLVPSINALTLAERVELAERERLKGLETATQTRKRKVEQIIKEEEEDEPPPETAESVAGPPPKKRPNIRQGTVELESVVEVEESHASAPITKSKAPVKSAKPTQVDKDAKYLTALASTRKGKKKEDAFDRDFNKLKIAKPRTDEIELDDLNAAMIAWQAADIDMNLRGNFMVCQPTLVPREPTQAKRRKEGNPEWVGRPDFKKFKKKNSVKRNMVQLVANLVLSEDEEDSRSTQEDEDFQELTVATHSRKKKLKATQVQADSGDESDIPVKPSTRGRSKTPAATRQTQTRKTPALFFDESEDERNLAAGKSFDESEEEEPPKTTKKTGNNKRPVVMALSSSDEDDRRKKKARRR
ncbi:SubName: Full=Related to proline-rich protein-Laccaria bicolor {ECO:0000313/EMBL:CCA69874.1} [Serendipita indica DSM 11827]|nr:SubName: Full=Related to proline-rich protein-Laccaria bicolor {ECO:0000313/EMBL:CCA69874.1} [Serendipita indica DSM 11827]